MAFKPSQPFLAQLTKNLFGEAKDSDGKYVVADEIVFERTSGTGMRITLKVKGEALLYLNWYQDESSTLTVQGIELKVPLKLAAF